MTGTSSSSRSRRPERRNAFDAGLIAELAEAFADVGDARAVVLAGEGQSFCAGADVEWQRSSIELSYEENVEDYRRLWQMLDAVWRCPAPVVGRIHGYALGGGSGLTCCTDIAIAATGCGLRVLRGAARDHPGRDLADGAGPDRPGRSAAVLPHRGADRRGDGAPDRPRSRGRGRPRRGGRARGRGHPRRRARSRRARRSASSSSRATRRTCWPAPPSGARATRARRACAPSSRSAVRAGPSSPAALQFRGCSCGNCWWRTAARSPFASSERAVSSGSQPSRSPRPTTRARCTRASRTRRSRSRPTSTRRSTSEPRSPSARTRSTPATDSSRRTATSPRRSRRQGSSSSGLRPRRFAPGATSSPPSAPPVRRACRCSPRATRERSASRCS